MIGWLGDQAMYRNEAFDGRGVMEGRTDYGKAVERFLSALENIECPFTVVIRTGTMEVSEERQHWGIWHDGYKAWYKLNGPLFQTDSRALALFELEGVPDSNWRVRCIEEWADERQAGS